MKTHANHRATARLPKRSDQRGVVLLFSLIALVIMLIAAVALMRSFNSSLFTAGNIAFKRDMQNQSERAVDTVLTAFRTGNLNTPSERANSDAAQNYSAAMLATNAQGIPTALLTSDTTFDAAYTAPILASTDASIKIRYLIDRLCSATGNETTLGSAGCVLADNPTPAGSSSANLQGADRAPLCATCSSAAPQGVVYRLSIKVTGPRNTQSFFQSTFTVPS